MFCWRSFKSRSLSPRQLAKLGMRHVPERNEFFFEPQAKGMQAHAAPPAAAHRASRRASRGSRGRVSQRRRVLPPPLPAHD